MPATNRKRWTLITALSITIIAACLPPIGFSSLFAQTEVTVRGNIRHPIVQQPLIQQPTVQQPTIEQPAPQQPVIQQTDNITDTTRNTFLGLSGYPTSTTEIDSIIEVMNANGLNIYRMSFNPEWARGPHPYHASYIQYFLDHSSYTIIVDRNHLYPPQESTAQAARDNWATAQNSIFEVLETWPNNPRVMVELINEYISEDFYPRMQTLVDQIRAAGYANPIVVNKWNQPWTRLNDQFDLTYQGYHFYFNTWSVSGALSQVNTALSRGIKLISTEVGADYNEYRSFVTATVDELNTFLAECANLGVGNTVWMNENLNNWPTYKELGLAFPAL